MQAKKNPRKKEKQKNLSIIKIRQNESGKEQEGLTVGRLSKGTSNHEREMYG